MQCRELTAIPACLLTAGVPTRSIVAHYEYGAAASGATTLVATRYTEADGVTVITLAAGQTVSPGSCPVIAPDIEWERMCDVQADGSVIEFYHRIITTFAADGTPTVSVLAVEGDKVTVYTPTGTVEVCGTACSAAAPQGVVTTWG